jgi:hypothetical protein
VEWREVHAYRRRQRELIDADVDAQEVDATKHRATGAADAAACVRGRAAVVLMVMVFVEKRGVARLVVDVLGCVAVCVAAIRVCVIAVDPRMRAVCVVVGLILSGRRTAINPVARFARAVRRHAPERMLERAMQVHCGQHFAGGHEQGQQDGENAHAVSILRRRDDSALKRRKPGVR